MKIVLHLWTSYLCTCSWPQVGENICCCINLLEIMWKFLSREPATYFCSIIFFSNTAGSINFKFGVHISYERKISVTLLSSEYWSRIDSAVKFSDNSSRSHLPSLLLELVLIRGLLKVVLYKWTAAISENDNSRASLSYLSYIRLTDATKYCNKINVSYCWK